MKNICLILVATVLASSGFAQSCSQGPCPIVGTPHVDGGPVFTIDRYLGRAVNMTSISDRRERINSGQTDNLYCSDIQLAVELRASYLRRVTGVFTKADGMAIGAAYHTAAQQAITDILWAFDCAGLERPIIEGAFYEYVDNSVNNVPIPQYVLNEFQNDPAFAGAGYSTSGSYNFDIAKMLYTAPAPLHTDPNHTPDVSKITSRMGSFIRQLSISIWGHLLHMPDGYIYIPATTRDIIIQTMYFNV